MHKLILCAALLASLSACNTMTGINSAYAPAVRVPALVPGDMDSKDYKELTATMESIVGKKSPPDNTVPGLIRGADDSDRDQIAGMMLSRSNAICNRYLAEITTSQRTWRTTFSVLGLAFGTAGSVATPERSKGLLSALAGGMSGMSGKLDEGLLSNQAGHLIRGANIQQRKILQDALITDLSKGGRYENVSLPYALALIEDYHSRCSIDDGLTFLNKEVAQAAPTAATPPSTPAAATAPDGAAAAPAPPTPTAPAAATGTAGATDAGSEK